MMNVVSTASKWEEGIAVLFKLTFRPSAMEYHASPLNVFGGATITVSL